MFCEGFEKGWSRIAHSYLKCNVNAPSLTLFENDQCFEKTRKKAKSSTKIPNPSQFHNPYQKPKGKYSKKKSCKKLEIFFPKTRALNLSNALSHVPIRQKLAVLAQIP